MMKKWIALLLLAAMMMGAMSAGAEVAAPVDEPVLARVGEEPVLLSEVQAILPHLGEYLNEETGLRQAVDFVVNQRLLEKKIAELGMNSFTEEEEATFAAEAQTQWDEAIESYVRFYQSEDTEEARAAMRDQAIAYYTEQGYSPEALQRSAKQGAALNRLTEHLMDGYEPTEEEIQQTFQQFGASYQENYQDNIMAYEYNTIYGNQPSWYTPEGYRGIIHILLQPDAALMDNYARLVAAYEEQQSQQGSEATEPDAGEQAPEAAEASEAPAAEAADLPEVVTKDMVDQARQAILDSVKTEVDSIYAAINAGESFESIIGRLGQDPGMQVPENLENGYMVHRDSVVWDPVFTQAAFSEKMQQVGDVSDPVVGSNGVHILKYKRDVEAGLNMTEQIRADIADYLRAVKENSVFMEALETWKQEANVVFYDDAILAAAAAMQPAQTLPETPEAVESDEGEQPVAEEAETPAP